MEANFHHALKIREDLCEGCSHCMNVCPTEALRVKNGKAVLFADKCVDCGKCFRECPSSAIIIDHDDFSHIFEYNYRVALIPAVFSAQFPEEISQRQILSVLLEIGFTHVYEVENGAEVLSEAIQKYADEHKDIRPIISSFCPAIVRLIQVKFPALTDNIMLLKPPLDIAANFIKKEMISKGIPENEIGIFYVTPCAAKIAAIKEPVGETSSPITGAINMDFLFNKVYHQVARKSNQSCAVPVLSELSEKARKWSLTNGEAQHIKGRCLAIDEIHNVIEFLEKIENDEITDIDFLELRACDESCAGGVLVHGNRFLTVERLKNNTFNHSNTDINNHHPDAFRPIIEEKEFLMENIGINSVNPRSIMILDEDMAEAMRKMDKVNQVIKILPMIDCSLCGAPTCQSFAHDIVMGEGELKECVFIQRTMEQNGELTSEESNKILRNIWGFEKTNKYRKIKS
ncbi:MAG: [Fe-Fe] hydrogenase large subunit C-terminal domain-containing protein [Chloroflexota bacterium]|nr:[Fe-Fe] hydrogenase large subunit C-terminal domain-containing protein [Lentimicrobium sp.]